MSLLKAPPVLPSHLAHSTHTCSPAKAGQVRRGIEQSRGSLISPKDPDLFRSDAFGICSLARLAGMYRDRPSRSHGAAPAHHRTLGGRARGAPASPQSFAPRCRPRRWQTPRPSRPWRGRPAAGRAHRAADGARARMGLTVAARPPGAREIPDLREILARSCEIRSAAAESGCRAIQFMLAAQPTIERNAETATTPALA